MGAYNDDKIFSVELVGAVNDFCAIGLFPNSELSKSGAPPRIIRDQDARPSLDRTNIL